MTNKSEKEKTARRKVLKHLVDLRNDHKVASILVWITSWGTSFLAPMVLKRKLKEHLIASVPVPVRQPMVIFGLMLWKKTT